MLVCADAVGWKEEICYRRCLLMISVTRRVGPSHRVCGRWTPFPLAQNVEVRWSVVYISRLMSPGIAPVRAKGARRVRRVRFNIVYDVCVAVWRVCVLCGWKTCQHMHCNDEL